MRNRELGPKIGKKEEAEAAFKGINKEELLIELFTEPLIEDIERLKTTNISELTKDPKAKKHLGQLRYHIRRGELPYKNLRDFLKKEGLRISKKEETTEELKEETIAKLKEAMEKLGTTSTQKVQESEYKKFYSRFNKDRKKWGYRNWEDFVEKTAPPLLREAEKLAKEAWRGLFMGYKKEFVQQIDIEPSLKSFLKAKYLQTTPEVEKKARELLENWREKKLEK